MHEDFYITLLYKQLSGEISATEAEELRSWRSSDPEHEAQAQAVELAWQATAPVEEVPNADLDAAFAELSLQMEAAPATPSSARRRRLIPRWAAAAASILLLVTAGYFLFMRPDPIPEIVWTEAEAGKYARTVTLADQTQVHLRANSRIEYPTTMDVGERRVKLTGTAFFQVSHNPDQPFIVNTRAEEVRVLGTSFLVRSLPNDKEAYVYVETGRVQVSMLQTDVSTQLSAGQAVVTDRVYTQITADPEANPNVISWHSGKLYFEQSPLATVLQRLDDELGLDFDLGNPALADCPLDATADRNNIEAFVETLTTIFEAEVVLQENGTYQINGGRCP